MKIICCNEKCNKVALWRYMPGTDNWAYCDDCVPRGCSCTYDLEGLVPDKDSLGRLEPCCEYDYSEEGYNEDDIY